ncbi:MAG: ATP-binding protein [Rhodoglobus sp.]
MRLAVLTRDDAARVITGATGRSAWAANAANLALGIPILIEYLTSRGLTSAIAAPLSILLVMIGLAVAAALRPRPWMVVTFLVAGAIGAIAFQLAILSAVPTAESDALFLLNRPAVSLVLVAGGATTWFFGLAWIIAGLLVSTLVTFAVAAINSSPPNAGWGPLLVFVIYVVSYLLLANIQASARRRVPNFEQLEEETRSARLAEDLRVRVTAVVHDTLLNDLSIVMNAPDTLDKRVTDRLRLDLDTLTSADWLRESAQVPVDDQDSEMRNELMKMMSDLQWRGLTVHITGSGTGIYRLGSTAAVALVDSVRACLENVLRHSGATVAEVDLAYSENEVTVIVSDQGGGFDTTQVPDDRLGIRRSVVDRMEAVGGSVRVWSAIGSGTSIVIRVPVLEILAPHEDSTHQREVGHGSP